MKFMPLRPVLLIFLALFILSCNKKISLNRYANEKWTKASCEIEASERISYTLNEPKEVAVEATSDVVPSSTVPPFLNDFKTVNRGKYDINTEDSSSALKASYSSIRPASKLDDGTKEKNPLAVKAFIYSLVGLLLAIPLVNIIISIIGLRKGLKALRQFKEEPDRYKGKGFAKAAVWISVFALFAITLILAAYIYFIIEVSKLSEEEEPLPSDYPY